MCTVCLTSPGKDLNIMSSYASLRPLTDIQFKTVWDLSCNLNSCASSHATYDFVMGIRSLSHLTCQYRGSPGSRSWAPPASASKNTGADSQLNVSGGWGLNLDLKPAPGPADSQLIAKTLTGALIPQQIPTLRCVRIIMVQPAAAIHSM